MLNYYRWTWTILPALILLTISLGGGQVRAQRDNVSGGRIRERIQLYRERRQQQSPRPTQSSGETKLVSHKLKIGSSDREYYLFLLGQTLRYRERVNDLFYEHYPKIVFFAFFFSSTAVRLDDKKRTYPSHLKFCHIRSRIVTHHQLI
jgi:hypothetical protein